MTPAMLDGLYFDERYFWLIPLAFYVADNIKTIDEHELILLEDRALRWHARLDKTPFLARGKHLYVLPLLLPYTIAFKLPWFRAGKAQEGVTAFRRQLVRWRAHAGALRTIGVCSFVLLFLVAPVLTLYRGLFNTLLVVLPPHLLLVLAAALLLCMRRRALRLGRWQTAGAIAELVLVPGFLPNLCRRIAWAALPQEVDGVAALRRVGDPAASVALDDAVRFRLSEDWLGEDDAAAGGTAIAAYRRELGL